MKLKKKSLFSPKTFNYLYSIGASIVILGALFKLLHVSGADLMLIIGMGTEAFIFFVSAFDEPAKEPNWENVYPGIYKQTLSDEEKQQIADRRAKQEDALEQAALHAGQGSGTTIIGGTIPNGGTIVLGSNLSMSEGSAVNGNNGGSVNVSGVPSSISSEQADQVAAATTKYVQQMSDINNALEKLSTAMQGIGGNENYAEQISQLNRNIQGLNTIYEIQLKNVSAQLATIEEVNRGLNNIRSLYENGQNDSYRIRQESDQLARNLQQLNEVYARMLSAMTSSYVSHVPNVNANK